MGLAGRSKAGLLLGSRLVLAHDHRRQRRLLRHHARFLLLKCRQLRCGLSIHPQLDLRLCRRQCRCVILSEVAVILGLAGRSKAGLLLSSRLGLLFKKRELLGSSRIQHGLRLLPCTLHRICVRAGRIPIVLRLHRRGQRCQLGIQGSALRGRGVTD